MRITVTAKGDLETYIKAEMDKTGLSAGMVCLNLALAGKEYKESLKNMSVLASALDGLNRDRLRQINEDKEESSGKQ